MIKYISVAIFFFLTNNLSGQNQIEINPFMRFDKYPQFSYVLGGRPSTDYINIKGTSFGIKLAYKIPISKLLFIKPGVGYYNYSFNNITRNNSSFGITKSRNINFISPILIPYFTDKYQYNTLSANIALEKNILLKKNFQCAFGVEFNNYVTLSQKYHLVNNPIGKQDVKKSDTKYFGSSGILFFNLIKRMKQLNVGPSIIIPVFDFWKTDASFQEEKNNDYRNKWFNGIGLGISFNYSFK